MSTISLYPKLRETLNSKDIDLYQFYEFIQNGAWQDYVLPVRTIKEKKARNIAKEKLPYVTISGKFKQRNNEGLEKHSGVIAIDLDNEDNPDIVDRREELYADEYVSAGFISASGRGVCLIYRIEPSKHLEAFEAIEARLYDRYKVFVDIGCKDVSRPRYVTYDPDIFIRGKNAPIFKEYLEKKEPKKIENFVYAEDDFNAILQEVTSRGISLCESYFDWMRISFALADKFGSAGLEYFNLISSTSSKYKGYLDCKKQFDHATKKLGSGTKRATISIFYYLAKQAGVSVYSNRTKTIINASLQAKNGGRTKEQVALTLKDFEGIENAESVIEQVFESSLKSPIEEGIIEQVEMYLKYNHSLKKNLISRRIEDFGIDLEEEDLNTIFLQIKKIYNLLSYELFERIIKSKNTVGYNPLKNFFDGRAWDGTPRIEALAETLITPDPEFTKKYFKKWYVSIISAIYGEASPLLFLLTGGINSGKTEWFRRMLPRELYRYYAENKLDNEKDGEIMMCNYIMIMDDEWDGSSKKEDKRLRNLLSKFFFTLREPYGRHSVTMRRLAVLCGTSNPTEVIADPSLNRRIIAIIVLSINHEAYNAIDKTQMLLEAKALYDSGFEWKLKKEDIEELKEKMSGSEKYSKEYELIMRYFRNAIGDEEPDWYSATEIQVALEKQSQQRLSSNTISAELKRMGFTSKMRKVDGRNKRSYDVVLKRLESLPITHEDLDI